MVHGDRKHRANCCIAASCRASAACPSPTECDVLRRSDPHALPLYLGKTTGERCVNVYWILYKGLRRYGYDFYADQVKQAIIELPRLGGFFEHFNLDNGQGHGAENFSWTAALLLDVLLEEQSHDE